jgi:DNA topoisomerase-1
MSKKYSTTTTLIIVESPAKCKKIEEYLGPGYKCIATYGHLRELLSLKNINFENNFEPSYTIIDNAIKKKQIENIRKEIKKADEVILSLDADREGEKISYCVAQIFDLNIEKTKRITFNEITESALQKAIKNPTRINMNIVHAQQARQILDLLVGFQVSPMLWKYISKNSENSLSAGRCQTPALRLIYDRQKEINESKEEEKYNTTGFFTNLNIPFDLSPQGKFGTKDEVIDFLDSSSEFNHLYTCSKPIIVFKKSPEPFTTSSLQQTASNELHFSPKETMKVCQSLYEGGYITYMRTDSKKYSKEFIESTKDYITRTYEEKYINENINDLINNGENNEPEIISKLNNSKSKNNKKSNETSNNLVQEAHEAIRPTNISLKELPETLESKEKRMYKLIWENTLESCMSSSSFYSITANITSSNNLKFTHTSELINFPGWKIVSKKYINEINPDNKVYHYLQSIKQNQIVPYKKIISKVTLTNIKSHYTEARLVQLLEEKGIGRPSTFAMLIDKIQERGYVKREDVKGKEIICADFELENGEIFEIETKREFGNEKNKLVLQPLGQIVMDFLEKNFNELFNYNYTKQMEDDLDKISQGNKIWHELCKDCNDQISNLINNLKDESKLEIKIDENNSYIIGKYGPVIKTTTALDGKSNTIFNKVMKNIDIHKIENGEYKLEEIIDTNHKRSQYNLGKYQGHDVILQKGKFGLYISWDKNTKTLKELGNQPIESITFKDVEKYLDEGSNIIREISDNITIRKSVKGEYIFYKTAKMKKPIFYNFKGFENDYKNCDINILKTWLKETHKIF